MSTESQTMPPFSAPADEIAWLQALHALDLCQQVAELAARVHRVGWGEPARPAAVPASAASSSA
jgi:hypothetical protein